MMVMIFISLVWLMVDDDDGNNNSSTDEQVEDDDRVVKTGGTDKRCVDRGAL